MKASSLAQFDGQLLDGLEFCSKVYALFEQIRSEHDGPSRLRRRPTRVEKKLLEELLPICKYVQASYRPGRYISVRWMDGNQQYDAELLQNGDYVAQSYYPEAGFLEVTCAVHPKEYLLRELLDKKGVAFGSEGARRLEDGEIESIPVLHRSREFVESYAALVIKQIEKKAKIHYPENTTLVVQCTLNRLYMPDEWGELMARVRAALRRSGFREIYVYDTVRQYSQVLYPE
jgi:hypothetical protein